MNEVINQVLDSVVSSVQALGLSGPAGAIPVVKRKLPTKEETLDPATQIVVCVAAAMPGPRRFCQGVLLYVVPVEITLVSPSPGDTLKSLPVLGDVYGSVRDAFARTGTAPGGHPVTLPAGAASVHRVEPSEGAFLDRPRLNFAYDYQAQLINVYVLVPTRGALP